MPAEESKRIAHLSDLHFGDPKTLAEVESCTAFAIDAAVDAGAELAVISGDSTDHAIDVHLPSFGRWRASCAAWRTIVRC